MVGLVPTGTQSKFEVCKVVQPVAVADWKIIGFAAALTTILILRVPATEMSHSTSAPKTYDPK